MLKRSQKLAAVVTAVLLAACGTAAPATTTTTTSTTLPTTTSTSTTVAPTTTTTLPPFTVEGSPPELTALVDSFYEYSAGRSPDAPPLPGPVGALTPTERVTPRHGVASVGVFHGQSVATVQMSDDLILAVDDGSGWRIVGGDWPSLGLRYFGGSPRLVAVIGSDARPGEDQNRSRGDSIHIVGLDGSGGGGVVGIPRDSYVQVPGIGSRKINAALSLGGPDTMLETLRQLTGLPIEGYVLTGFVGFQEIFGNVLGGADFDVPFSLADPASGAYFSAGLQYLNGPAALSLARARKTLPGGDFARSQMQGELILAAARAVQAKGLGAIPPLMQGAEPWLATNLSPEQLLTFSGALSLVDLNAVTNLTAPGRAGRAGNSSVVYLSDSTTDIWADLADGRLGG